MDTYTGQDIERILQRELEEALIDRNEIQVQIATGALGLLRRLGVIPKHERK